jgi:hypothetical protein
VIAMKSTVRINPIHGALIAATLVGLGCAPSPDVVQAGASRVGWSPETTRSPALPDADLSGPDPTGTGGTGGGGGDPTQPPPRSAPDAGTVAPGGKDASSSDVALPPAPGGPGQACQLTFQVTTVTFGGDYSPRNVGAIWIADAAGKFVKSLTVWGRRRLSHLVRWESASGGSTVDAVTSASANNHTTRMATWDCTGVSHQAVANGSYTINVEFTEQNAFGRQMTPLPFTHGAGPVDVSPADQANFKSIHLKVTP